MTRGWNKRQSQIAQLRRLGRGRLPYHARETLLTTPELRFYRGLRDAVGRRFMIVPRVRLADVVNCSDEDWNRGHGDLLGRRHIDFVLYDWKTSRTIARLELDETSHYTARRRERDGFVNQALHIAGIPLTPRVRRHSAAKRHPLSRSGQARPHHSSPTGPNGELDAFSRTPRQNASL